MNPKIQSLLDVWKDRPSRIAPINDSVLTPENESDIAYIYGRLLPALVSAMPTVEALADVTLTTPQAQPLVQGVSLQSSDADLAGAQAAEPSNHTPTWSPIEADNASATDQTAGTPGTTVIDPATPPVKPDGRKEALARARAAKAARRNGVPPSTQQQTAVNETA